MTLLMGIIIGVIVATAAPLSAEFGTWFDPQSGETGTWQSGPLGTFYQDMAGRQGFLQIQPAAPFAQRPCF